MPTEKQTQDDTGMIWPGDPRHPCPICGGRSAGMHFAPCAPVPPEQAYRDDKEA